LSDASGGRTRRMQQSLEDREREQHRARTWRRCRWHVPKHPDASSASLPAKLQVARQPTTNLPAADSHSEDLGSLWRELGDELVNLCQKLTHISQLFAKASDLRKL